MIQEWIFRYTKKRMPQRNVVFPNYSKVRSVALLYEQGVDDKGIAMLVKQLERDRMMVEIIGYEPKKDYNHFGKPRKEAMAALPVQRFDLLLDLSTHYYLGTQYLIMAIDATFKAGLRFADVPEENQQGVLDMMVNLQGEVQPEQIAEQVMHYLKMINA